MREDLYDGAFEQEVAREIFHSRPVVEGEGH